ncbi:MAG TPA: hypothetical protein VM029_00215, partial [Opitutaceae bacterium]|nr:hypothetical protein [Opitutaceae bacterium]
MRLPPCLLSLLVCALPLAPAVRAQRQMENLGRGVIALRTDDKTVFVSWRVLGTDPDALAFNLYRATDGGAPVKLNAAPIAGASNHVDRQADATHAQAYFVRPVRDGHELGASTRFTVAANAPARNYLSIPLEKPANGTTPDGAGYGYNAND